MAVVYWEFKQCNTVLTLKTKMYLTEFVLLKVGLSTCKMMSIRFLNQYIKLMSHRHEVSPKWVIILMSYADIKFIIGY